MPLPGGLNDEKEDLLVPLPAEWTAQSLTDVVFYQMRASPPCCKIRALLRYYKVPFKSVDGKKPDSPYKKVPVLDVNGRQINDSYIIVKNLMPILNGKPLDEAAIKMEEFITYEAMISFEQVAFDSSEDLKKFAAVAEMDKGFTGFMLPLLAPVASMFFSRSLKSKYPNLKSPEECLKHFKSAFATTPFFHGDAIGPIDISMYAIVAVFHEAKIAFIEEAIKAAGLQDWFGACKAQVPSVL